jgi:hypothetical protein
MFRDLRFPWAFLDSPFTSLVHNILKTGDHKEEAAVFGGAEKSMGAIFGRIAKATALAAGHEVIVDEATPLIETPEASSFNVRGGALRIIDRLDLSWEAYGLLGNA